MIDGSGDSLTRLTYQSSAFYYFRRAMPVCGGLFIRTVIAVAGAGVVAGARQEDFDVAQAPVALLVLRDIGEDVLILQLMRHLPIHLFHLVVTQRREDSAASACRQIGD